jgi:hypothetical protein
MSDREKVKKIIDTDRPLWQAGWDYGQGLKASRELEPAPLKPEDIDPFHPIEQL